MRKPIALLVLVPFAAVLVLSCDDHPTAPEEAQAATTVPETSAPQATRIPALPTPVRLSGVVEVGATLGTVATGSINAYAACPEGKWPISGGFDIDPVTNGYRVVANRPGPSPYGPNAGAWIVTAVRESGDADWTLEAWAICVDGVPGTTPD